MATYYNPYVQAAYPGNSYTGAMYQIPAQQMMPQSYAPTTPPMQGNVIGVDGEIGAKAFNIPNGSTGPIALWDTNDNVIYMRSFNAAGMPMPLKKLRYVEEELTPALPAGNSGAMDTSQFVTKNDLEQLRNEIRQMTAQNQNHAGNQNGGQSRGQNNQGRQG